MKFLRKSKSAVKNAAKLKKVSPDLSDTPALAAMVKSGATDGDLGDLEIAKRKAEFLELLAKEERAHRVKLAEMRDEPVTDHRSEDRAKPASKAQKSKTQSKTQSKTEPKTEPKTSPPAKTAAPADISPASIDSAETAPTIRGNDLGGSDFHVGSEKSVSPAKIEIDIPETIKGKDVTSSFEKAQKAALYQDVPPVRVDPLRTRKAAPPMPAPRTNSAPDTHRDTVSEHDIEHYKDMDFTRPIQNGRADVNELRLDVSRIHTDIENGDALYRRAQQRVQGLMSFVDKAEVDFSLLERIEPENRRLKARNAMIGRELEEFVRKTSQMEVEIEEHRRRLVEVNVQYDTVNGNLAKAMKALSERDHEIRQLTNDISATTLKLDREKTATDVEIRENKVLRERVVNLTNELEDAKAGRADTSKIVESLKIDLDDHRTARERLDTETYDLRRALDEAQKQNMQMKGEMVALHQDISTFKTQYEFNLISRDDRITLLEGQIEDLARQLQVKEDIVSSAARDVTELRKSRTGGELERERLEKIIDTQTLQLEQAQKEITDSRAAMQDMDTRYRDVAAALSVTQHRRSNQRPVESPDIRPKPAPSSQDPVDDYGTTGTDPIEDHVMAYKLGLRKDIIPKHLEDAPKVEVETEAEESIVPRPVGFETLDQDTIAERIMDYKLGLRKNIF